MDVTVPAVGVGGAGLIVTSTELAGEVQPATVCVTLMVYMPLVNVDIVVVFEVELTRPAEGEEALHAYVAPALTVTAKATETPGQTGFGLAVRLAGAVGAEGSNKVTGPA